MPTPSSPLQVAVKEIVEALLAGDWTRFSTDVEQRFYYVVRESDRLQMEADGVDWNTISFQAGRVQSDFEDWYVRAVLAEPPSDYFRKARKALKRAGLDSKVIQEVISAANAAHSAQELRNVVTDWLPRLTGDEADLRHLLAFLEAVRIKGVETGQFFLSDAERQTLKAAFELRFLKELAERFPKVVDRATDFDDWLSYYSPHLREAVRCYLYGFFSASILVAVAALDVRFNTIAHMEGVVPYKVLVAGVFGVAGVLGHDPALAAALETLFEYRNEVAHGGVEARRDKAIEVLLLVRATLDRIESGTPDDAG